MLFELGQDNDKPNIAEMLICNAGIKELELQKP